MIEQQNEGLRAAGGGWGDPPPGGYGGPPGPPGGGGGGGYGAPPGGGGYGGPPAPPGGGWGAPPPPPGGGWGAPPGPPPGGMYGGPPPGAMVMGAPYGVHPVTGIPYSDKSKVVAGVLQIVVPFGIGRFYTGHTGLGVIQLVVVFVTCGIGAIWPFIDDIMMLMGNVPDAEGRPLRD